MYQIDAWYLPIHSLNASVHWLICVEDSEGPKGTKFSKLMPDYKNKNDA